MTDADPRAVLEQMHALALATLHAPDSAEPRAHLDALADYAPDAIALRDDDPRSDAALARDVSPAPRAARFAARLRGAILGASAHADTVRKEMLALARESVRGEDVADAEIDRRTDAAWERTRADLATDIVRLASTVVPPSEDGNGAWVRRWGAVRALELNAFVATFTRDGTHPGAREAMRRDPDAAALRFAMAVAEAAMSLAPDATIDAALLYDARRTDVALPALLAALIAAAR